MFPYNCTSVKLCLVSQLSHVWQADYFPFKAKIKAKLKILTLWSVASKKTKCLAESHSRWWRKNFRLCWVFIKQRAVTVLLNSAESPDVQFLHWCQDPKNKQGGFSTFIKHLGICLFFTWTTPHCCDTHTPLGEKQLTLEEYQIMWRLLSEKLTYSEHWLS